MSRTTLAAAFAAASLAGAPSLLAQTTTLAYYSFNNSLASSDNDSLSSASNVSPTDNYVFYDDNLCLSGNWDHGELRWSINPSNTTPVVYTTVEFAVAQISQTYPNVDEVELRVDGVAQGFQQISNHPAGDVFVWNLDPNASFQNSTGTTQFVLHFHGNSGSMFELEYLKCKGRRSPTLDPGIGAVGSCENQCFDVTGRRLDQADAFTIDGVEIGNTGWSIQLNGSSGATVCPPSPRVAGSYVLGAEILGTTVAETTLTIDLSAPVLSVVQNPSLPLVTDQCFLITGCGLSNVTSVQFGPHTITSQDPNDFGRGYFVVANDTSLEVCPPLCLTAGGYAITLVSPQGSSDPAGVQLTDPTTPTLACAPTFVHGSEQRIYLHSGGQPGPNAMFLALSSVPLPSVLPNIVSLGIGDQFTSIIVLNAPAGECSEVSIGVVGQRFIGLSLYFQGIVWNFANPVLPLPTTQVCSTFYY
ncbi:MAG: hypothetical protein KDE27_27110 [Planctomycetes bacterium]|nr:hypothetical protein [Planctomycetota bacterium]